jgi:RNA polymerase sigma factor (sigma-70 family)
VNPKIPHPQQGSSGGIELDEFVERKKAEIYKYTRKRVWNDSDALELTQEILVDFITYSGKRSSLSEEVASKVLYTIAKRRIIDWYKAVKKTPAPTDDDVLLESLSQQVPGIENDAVLRADLAKVLSQLTDVQRTALIRVYVNDMDYASAAKAMKIGVDNLKYHLKMAKTHARSLLEQSSTPMA